MLIKLMKYELRATGRVFLPLFLALLVFALINRFTLGLSSSQQWGIPAVISMAVYLFILIGMFVMVLIMTIQRFYKNLLSEEGYLMLTLPVKPWQHIVSKMLISMFWVVLSSIIALVSIVVIAFKEGDWEQIMKEAGPFLQEIFDYLGASSIVLLSLEAILGLFLTLASAILILYASIAIGHLFNRHRILASFAAFIGLNTLTQIITMIIMARAGDVEYNINITPANLHAVQTEFHLAILFFLGVSALFCAAYFAVTHWILDKRLNLE